MATTTIDLFRAGNATSARLSHVRALDVSIFSRNGVDWVTARSGGISTFDAKVFSVGGLWWRLPAGTTYDDSVLALVNDIGNHWSWEPVRDMPLASYTAALSAVNVKFIRA